jgi:hypothetical protein
MDLNPSVNRLSFQFAMIAFNHVVPVLNLSVFNVRRAPAFALSRASARRQAPRVESRDLPLLHVVEDCETGMQLCCYDGGEIKIDSAAPAVDGPYRYAQRPLTLP